MTRQTIWTPPGLPRAAEQRAFHVMIGLAGAVSGRSLSREQLMPHEVIVAAWPIRAGQPPSAGGPLTVSAAGWTVADPLRLLQNARDDVLWWGYLCLLARTATDLDMPRTASRWVAGELGTSWREAAHTQPDHLRALTRTASAAMTAVAEGEAHQRRLWTPDKDGAEEAWARMLRPDLGRPGWKAALDAVQSGHWSAGEIEPWGPMLDVSGAAPEAATETTMAAIGEALKRLARSVQGQARGPGAHTRPRRGVGGAPSPELDVDWCHDHPEVSAAWNAFEERGRAATTSRLAYQLGRRARDAAMARTLERVGSGGAGQEGGHLSGLARAMGDLSVALTPVLAGVRGDKQNEANERRVDAVLLAWSGVGQDIPHLRPALSQLQLELDPLRCLRMRVSGVALSPETKTVYVNLGAGWADDELRYGFAELALHLLLGHPERSKDKVPELWNLACDLLLAGWLEEMGYGVRPDGAPYDPALSRLGSAEAIYLRLLDDPAWRRRAPSLRGEGLPDMLGGGEDAARAMTEDEDRLWREAAARGMDEAQALLWAGTLPAGLRRELAERAAEPVPWRPALQAYLGSVVPVRVRDAASRGPRAGLP